MTRFLRALLLCAVCVSPAYAGDQSGIEPLRVEIGSAEAKPAFRSRVEVPARVSPTSGVIRSVQLGLPLSGAGMWRLSNFQF